MALNSRQAQLLVDNFSNTQVCTSYGVVFDGDKLESMLREGIRSSDLSEVLYLLIKKPNQTDQSSLVIPTKNLRDVAGREVHPLELFELEDLERVQIVVDLKQLKEIAAKPSLGARELAGAK